MLTFLFSFAILLVGYVTVGSKIEKVFGPDGRTTPAIAINDGVDYVPLKTWKAFLIELLNIAGTGPIFGALSGALFGPVVYLWIIFGCIFAGVTHDYLSGMISMRNNGINIATLTGKYLGIRMQKVMYFFTIILLVMVGVVFTVGPAELLAILTPEKLSSNFWFWVIIVYYFAATLVPIDKIIGKIYPVFAVCLIVMAVGVGVSLLFSGNFVMPEIWDNFENMHPNDIPIWPFMFITVACGAISGFHATQAPMVSSCLMSEKDGRMVFCGAMIAEGMIALVWAAAGVSCYENSQALLAAGGGCSSVVYYICNTTMGRFGGMLALLGVIVCPVTSGDTAYRSARLTISEWFRIDQQNLKNRLLVTIPLLAMGIAISRLNYQIVWRYFSWSNQTLAMVMLWVAAVYLKKEGKDWRCAFIPACFMSAVSSTYFFSAPECLGGLWKLGGLDSSLYIPLAYLCGILTAVLFSTLFLRRMHIVIKSGSKFK